MVYFSIYVIFNFSQQHLIIFGVWVFCLLKVDLFLGILFFWYMANGVVSLISLSDVSMWVYRNAGEGVEKKKPSYLVGGNANLCSHYGKQYGAFFKKLKIELQYDLAIPILGIYPEKIIKETYTSMFIAALFTIARTWEQPKCPIDDWVKKM